MDAHHCPSYHTFCLLCFDLRYLMFCKQEGQEFTLITLFTQYKAISHALHHQNTQTKGMG